MTARPVTLNQDEVTTARYQWLAPAGSVHRSVAPPSDYEGVLLRQVRDYGYVEHPEDGPSLDAVLLNAHVTGQPVIVVTPHSLRFKLGVVDGDLEKHLALVVYAPTSLFRPKAFRRVERLFESLPPPRLMPWSTMTPWGAMRVGEWIVKQPGVSLSFSIGAEVKANSTWPMMGVLPAIDATRLGWPYELRWFGHPDLRVELVRPSVARLHELFEPIYRDAMVREVMEV